MNPNQASEKEQEAIKLARSMSDERLVTLIALELRDVDTSDFAQLRSLGAKLFVCARRIEPS